MRITPIVVIVPLEIIVSLTSIGWTETIHVPQDFNTIQAGVDAATHGDTVLIAEGIYKGLGNREIDPCGKAIVIRSENGPDFTIIDGEQDGRVFDIHSGEGPDTKLEDLTISNGYAYRSYGGGIRCIDSSPTITNCIIANNEAGYSGGGIYCRNCSSSISNCSIRHNSGGGIVCSRSSLNISNCIIQGNSAGSGGGIYASRSFLSIIGSIISGNSAGYPSEYAEAYGGGICCGDANIRNCIISGNLVYAGIWYGFAFGGGISCGATSIINCTFFGNKASGGLWFGADGGGIYCEDSTEVRNCILWDDRPNELFVVGSGNLIVTYSDIEGGWEGDGNIDQNPLFRDPDNGDYHLMATYCKDPYDSPCIDAGHPDILDSLLDCFHGLGTEKSDMGAYGGRNAGWPTAVGEDEESETPAIPESFLLSQNYPNPFNSETWISYQLPEPGQVIIRVYNIQGQLVNTLVDEEKAPGAYRVCWSGRDLHGTPVASGVYFCKMKAGAFDKSIKMVLMK
jgi:hypothetical protein